MSVAEQLHRLGGVATRATLVRLTSRAEVDAAVAAGAILRPQRGRYVLAGTDEARAAAHALSGVLCLNSAALHWGWAVKHPPERPQVTVPRNRKVTRAPEVELHRLTLTPDDVVEGVTSPDRTLVDCLRHLPFDEALAVADSALRAGYSPERLQALVRDARGPRAVAMRHTARLASPAAANPFETVLRALALSVRDLDVQPQVSLWDGPLFLGRPDLVDQRLALVLEADSFEWHGKRAALHADARRYNALAARGWLVLRFSWEDVMFQPDLVTLTLERAVAERTNLVCPTCRAAS